MPIQPTQSDIGRRVIYRDLGGRGKIEEGVVTSFSDRYVFVRYSSNPMATSQATSPEDLEWSNRRPEDLAVSTVVRGGKVQSIDFCPLPQPPERF